MVFLDGKALGVVEVIPPEGFFDYDAKYTYNQRENSILTAHQTNPAEVCERLKKCSEETWKVLGCRHLTRLDVIWNPGDR